MFPDLSDEDIIAHAVHREPYVQPLQEIRLFRKRRTHENPYKKFLYRQHNDDLEFNPQQQ